VKQKKRNKLLETQCGNVKSNQSVYLVRKMTIKNYIQKSNCLQTPGKNQRDAQ